MQFDTIQTKDIEFDKIKLSDVNEYINTYINQYIVNY